MGVAISVCSLFKVDVMEGAASLLVGRKLNFEMM